MANPYFQFKKFTIRHDKCAMKVGTDAVLLGAWADTASCKNILDIGTGTGIIALMLAQRSCADIDAIDIDKEACVQAEENVAASPFAGRIKVIPASCADFARSMAQKKYDLIVSNPPYFNVRIINVRLHAIRTACLYPNWSKMRVHYCLRSDV